MARCTIKLLSLLLFASGCRQGFSICQSDQDCPGGACHVGYCVLPATPEISWPDLIPDAADPVKEVAPDVADAINEVAPDVADVIDEVAPDVEPDSLPDQAEETNPSEETSCVLPGDATEGLVSETRTRSGKASGLIVDNNKAYVSGHATTSIGIDKLTGPSEQYGIIESFDVTYPEAPNALGEPLLFQDQYGLNQEVWSIGMGDGALFAAADVQGFLGFDLPSGANQGVNASTLRFKIPPPGFGECTSYGFGSPTADYLTVATPPGWTQSIGLLGYSYCEQIAIYNLSGGGIPTSTRYRMQTPAGMTPGFAASTTWIDGETFILLGAVRTNDTQKYYVLLETVHMPSLTATPTHLGSVTVSNEQAGGQGNLAAAGDWVYWAASDSSNQGTRSFAGGLAVIDVKDRSHPKFKTQIEIVNAGWLPWKGANLALSGKTLVYAAADRLVLFDLEDPGNPVQAKTFPYPSSFQNCGGGYPVIHGDYVYVATNCFPKGNVDGEGTGGLAVYRMRAPRGTSCKGMCVDLESDRLNCGTCGRICGAYTDCVGSLCLPRIR